MFIHIGCRMKHLRELLFSHLCCLITLLFFCATALFSVDYINSFPQPPCSCATHAAQHNTIKPSINSLKSTANHMPHVSRAETQTSSSSCKTNLPNLSSYIDAGVSEEGIKEHWERPTSARVHITSPISASVCQMCTKLHKMSLIITAVLFMPLYLSA